MSDRGLAGKVVLVTGASSGIGAATAIELSRYGVRLALTGRNEVNLERVADDCTQQLTQTAAAVSAERPLTIVADLAVEDDVQRIVDKTIETFGQLDILINNAGAGAFGSLEDTSLEQFDQIMRVNVRAVFQLTKLAAPHLSKMKGNIVNVSSVGGSVAVPGFIAYSVSKSALDHLTRCIAVELAPKGVRVNAVVLGTIRSTQIRSRLGVPEDVLDKHYESQKKTHPLGRVGEPVDAARAIVFLASNDASFITGDHIFVDGGYHTHVAI